jgi:hypothetical protein
VKEITGYVVAWNAEPFIEPALEQAVTICDEVMVAVGPHSEHMKAFVDRTEEICLKFRDNYPGMVKLVPVEYRGAHSPTKGATLQAMVRASALYKPGNWVWLLDADEFYLRREAAELKGIIQSTDCNSVQFNERYFFINTRKHLVNKRRRLYKITAEGNTWKPTSKWGGPRDDILDYPGEGLFHYSALMNPHSKRAFWSTEYQADPRVGHPLVRWMDEVYMKYDLEDEDKWLDRNQQLFGVRTPFWIGDIQAGPDGKLVDYDGPHPEVIEAAGFTNIPDFRKIYRP